MPVFSEVLDRFRESGCFELQNTIVSFKQLDQLLENLVSSAQAPSPKFQLRDVTIVPFHQEELIDQSAPRNTALTGSLRKEELPALLWDRAEPLYSVDYKYDKALLFLSYMDISIEREIESEQIKAISEKILINLFKQAIWLVIKLENVTIVKEQKLGFQFMDDLYETLIPYAAQITELSLKQVDLFNRSALLRFLSVASRLKTLGLEDLNLENEIFNRLSQQPSDFLKRLCAGLVHHATLQLLDLGQSRLNAGDYQALLALLAHNYRLDKLVILKPSRFDGERFLYDELCKRMDERAEKSAFQRFKEIQLTLSNLHQLAEWALQSDEATFVKLDLNGRSRSKLAITYPAGETMSGHFLKKLPEGFRRCPEYTARCWPIHLDLKQCLEDQTSLGAHLLEKAFQLRKPEYMRLLLDAGANLLESLPDEPSLVGRIFAAKEEKIYKKIILDHVKKDLSVFVPFIARLLPSYKKIDDGLRDIKLQLDKFVTILLEQDQLPFLFKLFMGIGLEAKKENWEKDFRLIVTAAQVGTHKDPVTHSSLSNFEKMIEILYGEVEQAKNQWFRGYQFNCKLLESLKQLLESIKVYKNHLFIEWENGQAGGSLEQVNIKLQQKEKEYQEKIKNMRKQHAQDYADQEARFEARFANQEARFEAKLSKLFPHAAQEEAGASASYSHTSENSTHFFTRPSN